MGIDCNCPFNIPIQTVDSEFDYDIEDLNSLWLFLSPFGFQYISGDYDVTVTINNSANQHVACLRFKFTVNRALL